MIDRFGNTINVAYSEVEIIYLTAANQLLPYERACAFTDISEITGRSVAQLRAKANSLRNEAIQNAYKGRREAAARPLLVAAGGPGPKPAYSPHWTPTKARLMGGK